MQNCFAGLPYFVGSQNLSPEFRLWQIRSAASGLSEFLAFKFKRSRNVDLETLVTDGLEKSNSSRSELLPGSLKLWERRAFAAEAVATSATTSGGARMLEALHTKVTPIGSTSSSM